MRCWLVIAAIALLASCAQVKTFSAEDIANAQAVALASGLPQDAACWAAYAQLIAAEPNQGYGLATTVETKRAVQALASSYSCSAISVQLLQELVTLFPKAGLAAGQFAGF